MDLLKETEVSFKLPVKKTEGLQVGMVTELTLSSDQVFSFIQCQLICYSHLDWKYVCV